MKILVIPDTQVKEGVDTAHLSWVGQYIVDKKPDVIVHIGDHWDMPSLCSYDKGKKSFEGKRYTKDIAAGNEGMKTLLAPVKAEQARLVSNKKRRYNPRLIFCTGNHEERIMRAVNNDAMLEGMMGYQDLYLDDWEVYDYLETVTVEGVVFSHFFTSGVMGRPVTSARALLTKKHQSCVMGHVQSRDIAYARRADGTSLTGLFVGICYTHEEDYLGAQGNSDWRGVWMLNDVNDGSFDEMPISIKYLENKYG